MLHECYKNEMKVLIICENVLYLTYKIFKRCYFMKSKKVLSLLLACAVTISMGTTVFASTEDQIAAAQEQKQEAQVGLAEAQANISDLEKIGRAHV